MTISNHPPFIIPQEFKNNQESTEEQIVRYADHCIGQFMEKASKQSWYENTIFVFVGDHGRMIGKTPFVTPLSINHIPLIIYSPTFSDTPKIIDSFGGQIDIQPTVLGLLGLNYIDNSLGVDLLKYSKKSTVFTTDTRLSLIDKEYLYCFDIDTKDEYLYKHNENNGYNFIPDYREKADSMKKHAISTTIVTNYMLREELTKRKN